MKTQELFADEKKMSAGKSKVVSNTSPQPSFKIHLSADVHIQIWQLNIDKAQEITQYKTDQ